MKSIAKLLVMGGAIALSGTVWAQQNNNVPMSDPSSPQYNTVYMPNVVNGAQRGQPQERWEDRWGAFAVDPDGNWGIVTGMVSKRAAVRAAIAECKKRGGGNCTENYTFFNQCAAIAITDNLNSIARARGPVLEEVIESGLEVCREDGGSGCQIYWSGCSLPERVQ